MQFCGEDILRRPRKTNSAEQAAGLIEARHHGFDDSDIQQATMRLSIAAVAACLASAQAFRDTSPFVLLSSTP